MNSRTYIVSKINELSKNFPFVKFSYQLDELSETHFIEVLPKEIFEKYDDKFVKEQNIIVLDFIKKFPEQGLAFITEDDLFVVDRPEYIKYGNEYQGIVPNLSWNHEKLNELLVDFKPEIQTSFVVDQYIHEVKQNSVICKFTMRAVDEYTAFQPLTNNLPSESLNTDICVVNEEVDENDYFLAA